jgi:hypothetical protein
MKRLIPVSLLLATAIVAAAPASATPAPAADSCAATARQLSRKTVEFVKANADGRNAAQPAMAMPVNFYRGLDKRDAVLQRIVNDIWTMRADMANRNCSQAAAFSY